MHETLSGTGPVDPAAEVVLREIQARIDPAYRLTGLIGAGGMARVFRAWDERLARPVAVKVPHVDLGAQRDFAARFLREAQALGQIAHPHVIHVHFCTDAAAPFMYMVTELVDGPSLAEWMQSHGALPWETAVALVERCLAGLQTAHERGVLHRDLKPSNILIAPGGVPKLADFGLARLRGAATITRTDAPAGTLRYLAPEALDGPTSAPAQDLFAMGAVLYELIAGRPAFDQQAVAELLHKLSRAEYPPLARWAPDAWPEVLAIVDRAMALDPANRFATADAMRCACEAVLRESGISAGPFLAEFFADGDRAERRSAQRRVMAEHLASRARTSAMDGDDAAARLQFERIERLELRAGSPAVTTSAATAVTQLPQPRPPERVPDLDSTRPATGRLSEVREALTRTCLVAAAIAGACVAHLLRLDPMARGADAAWPSVALAAVACLVAAVTSRPWSRQVALGALLGAMAVAALLPAELSATLICHGESMDSLKEVLLVAGSVWLIGTVSAAALVACDSRVRAGGWLTLACAALVVSGAVGRDLVASAEKANAHLLRAIGHAVPPGAAPLQLGVSLGHTLPRESPRGCYAPPLSSADLVQHYARVGVPMLAVHLRQLDLAPWTGRPGAIAARPEDLALVAALRDWKRPLLLTSEAENSFEPRTLARTERFAAHTRFAAAVVLETGARYLELPAPDLDAAPSGDYQSSLDEAEVLLREEATALKRVAPDLKVGVTGQSSWTASGHEGDAEFLVRMATRPWIDWVGAQAYDTTLPTTDLNRLVVALRERRVDHKLFLFTGTACAPYARPPWKQDEDAARLREVGRWAQGRGVTAWIHKPGPTFSTYGWWFGGQRGAAQTTDALAAFLSFRGGP